MIRSSKSTLAMLKSALLVPLEDLPRDLLVRRGPARPAASGPRPPSWRGRSSEMMRLTSNFLSSVVQLPRHRLTTEAWSEASITANRRGYPSRCRSLLSTDRPKE